MDKALAEYMRYGKLVAQKESGEKYKIVDMDCARSCTKDTILCVAIQDYNKYRLLKTWEGNHVGLTEEQKNIMEGYEEKLKISELKPADTVRFITPHYETLFEVEDLSLVSVNGKQYRAVYEDECHLSLRTPDGGYGMGTYHICEFAELRKRHGWAAEPVSSIQMQKTKGKSR